MEERKQKWNGRIVEYLPNFEHYLNVHFSCHFLQFFDVFTLLPLLPFTRQEHHTKVFRTGEKKGARKNLSDRIMCYRMKLLCKQMFGMGSDWLKLTNNKIKRFFSLYFLCSSWSGKKWVEKGEKSQSRSEFVSIRLMIERWRNLHSSHLMGFFSVCFPLIYSLFTGRLCELFWWI